MDPLKDVLMKRAVANPTAPSGLPAPPPNPHSKLPPAMDRYKTAQRMQDAYANGWSPNPTLIRIMDHGKKDR